MSPSLLLASASHPSHQFSRKHDKLFDGMVMIMITMKMGTRRMMMLMTILMKRMDPAFQNCQT